jgi:16S rRNA (cytidine1402-2'-O)-methyltransferase
MKTGRLYLIPVPLGQNPPAAVLPEPVLVCARRLMYFVAENAKTARAFLKALPAASPLQQIEIHELNEHTPASALPHLLAPALAGHDLGLISEAGCPAVADPGADPGGSGPSARRAGDPDGRTLFAAARLDGFRTERPGLHLSRLPAQRTLARERRLHELEKESRQQQRTQIFIETPYRNRQLLVSLVNCCAPGTRLCVATDLTLADEQIATRTVAEWRRQTLPEISRRPTVFLLQAR